MDADRFDRWTRLLATRMSRRTAATGLGAAAVASLTAPRLALGQDDDQEDTDVDQHKDNPTGADPDDDGQTDDGGGDDTSNDDQSDDTSDDEGQSNDDGGDDTSDDAVQGDDGGDDDLGEGLCQDILYCGRQHCNSAVYIDGTGECHYDTIGNIPGGPYEQKWVWDIPPCTAKNISMRELEDKCNAAYPERCEGQCQACSTVAVPGWCN